VSSLQASLSGFEPGLEFVKAMEFVAKENALIAKSHKRMDIVLADQAVDETLARLDSLPNVSLDMFKDFCTNSRFQWDDSIYHELNQALLEAVWGPLDLSRVLMRSFSAMVDLIKLTLPPVICIQALLILTSAFVGQLTSAGNVAMETQAETLVHISSSAIFILVSYFFIVLPVVKVVISERDDQIASGISSACALMQRNNSERKGSVARIVAVLGLLHVNGVAKRLVEQPKV
jgi:pheromone shutdown protein TraB